MKKIEIIPSIFLDHNDMRLGINYKKKKKKKAHIHTEAKWYTTKQPMCNWRNGKNTLETKENENTMIINLWDAVKAVLRRKFIMIKGYWRKQEKSQIKNLHLDLKETEKEEQIKPKVSRKK